ncbi:MAG: Crp/Fnr family transcriptional regulator [Leadbetterella sp.]|nr:Crp/Fnr family transcriptional regulator [Leadbetterella sp.]
MTFKAFFTTIEKNVDLLPEEKKIIREYLREKTWLRGHFLIREEEKADRVFFIVRGLIKEYYLGTDPIHPEICTRFTPEGNFYYCIQSFVSGLPSPRYTVALEETVTLHLSRKELEELYIRVPSMQGLVLMLTEQYQAVAELRAELREIKPYAQRYLQFLETHKDIAGRLKMKDIACYLRMTPEALSRARKTIM